jgi:dynein heavy chain
MLRQALQNGNWVLLQNCHLAITWMPELEKMVEDFDETVH